MGLNIGERARYRPFDDVAAEGVFGMGKSRFGPRPYKYQTDGICSGGMGVTVRERVGPSGKFT